MRIAHDERPRYISTGAFLRVHISARIVLSAYISARYMRAQVLRGFVNSLKLRGREGHA